MEFFKSPPTWYRCFLGVAAFAPLAGVVFTLGTALMRSSMEPPIEAWLVFTILCWVILFYFIFDAALSGRVPEPKRRLWCIVLLLAHMAAIPFYWWFYLSPSTRG